MQMEDKKMQEASGSFGGVGGLGQKNNKSVSKMD